MTVKPGNSRKVARSTAQKALIDARRAGARVHLNSLGFSKLRVNKCSAELKYNSHVLQGNLQLLPCRTSEFVGWHKLIEEVEEEKEEKAKKKKRRERRPTTESRRKGV